MDRDIEFIRKIGEIGMMKTEEALVMIGGHIDEELLLRNEYLAAENEILRGKLCGRLKSQ